MSDRKSIERSQSRLLQLPQNITTQLSLYDLKLDLLQQPITSIDCLQAKITKSLGLSYKKALRKLNIFVEFINNNKTSKNLLTNYLENSELKQPIYIFPNVKKNSLDKFSLFCLLFNIRVKFYFLSNNRLSITSIGSKEKGKRTFNLLNSSQNYLPLNSTKPEKSQDIKPTRSPFVKKSFTPFNPQPLKPLKTNLEDTFKESIITKSRTMSSLENSPKSSSPQKHIGRLKFYNEAKEYGFILFDNGGEIFIHKTDLQQSNVNTAQLHLFDKFYSVRMEFEVRNYKGKSKGNRKAVEIRVLELLPKGN